MNPESIFDISIVDEENCSDVLLSIYPSLFARYSMERTSPHDPLAMKRK